MKLRLGKSPEDDFVAREEGWIPLREPSASMAQLIALPIGIGLVALVYFMTISITGFDGFVTEAGAIRLYSYMVILAFITIVPVHEMLHAVFFPGGLFTARTIIGFWPKMLAFYAHYNGIMSRNRCIAVFLAPFVLISIVPVLLMSLIGHYSTFLVIVCLVNALSACVDILGAFLFITRIPKNSIVRNNSWKTYWKKKE